MNRVLINTWYENQELIDKVITDKIEFKRYSDLLYIFAKEVMKLEKCEVNGCSGGYTDYFGITGIYNDKEYNRKYDIEISGKLEYGTCAECDLVLNLHDYGRRDKVKTMKLVLLNILQAAEVNISIYNDLPMETEEEMDAYFAEDDLIKKIYDKWYSLESPYVSTIEDTELLMFLLIYYYTLLGCYNDEKLEIFTKKIVFKEKLSDKEKEKIKLYRASLNSYPMANLIEYIINK